MERFQTPVRDLPPVIATIRNGRLVDQPFRGQHSGRTVLKGGRIVDPLQRSDQVGDLAMVGGLIAEVGPNIQPANGDTVIDAQGLIVAPGLLDMHLHLYDIPVFTARVMEDAATHGVTTGLTPGAVNTIRTPSFLSSEVDRGSLINMSCYLGAPAVLAFDLSDDEVVRCLRGEMDEDESLQKIARNRVAARTAQLAIGIKDHQAHMILSPRQMRRVAEIAQASGLLLMSHTQCPSYAEEMVRYVDGRPLHFGHADASGSGTHGPGAESLEKIIALIRDNANVSAEFTSTFLRASGGDRDGLTVTPGARQLALEAVKAGVVDVLVSDGPSETFKGFGDTRDNVPCLLELVERGILGIVDAVAMMTANPARLFARATGQEWWLAELGSLQAGTRADVIVVNPDEREVVFTFVGGTMVAIEGRIIRSGYGAGGWVTRLGILPTVGVGEMALGKVVWD
jgi:dihydroorotase